MVKSRNNKSRVECAVRFVFCFAFSRWRSASAQFLNCEPQHSRSRLQPLLRFIFVGMRFQHFCAYCGVISSYCNCLRHQQPCQGKNVFLLHFLCKVTRKSILKKKSGESIYAPKYGNFNASKPVCTPAGAG